MYAFVQELEKHECPEMVKPLKIYLDGRQVNGNAFDEIIKGSDGNWVASNDEYGTVITYCPFCGIKLENTN